MKCGIKVNNRQCKRNVSSGMTIEMLDSVVYCCTQHYAQYKNTPYMDIPLYVSTQKVINTNTPEEETMNTNNTHHQGIYVPIGYDEYDQEHSFENALAKLEGQPYTTLAMAIAGNFLIEACSHEDCHEGHSEIINECRGEICCGESDCQHYTALLCRYHISNNTPKEETMKTNYNDGILGIAQLAIDINEGTALNNVIDNNKEIKTMKTTKTISCGHCKGVHNTVQEVANCYGVVRTTNSSFRPTNQPMVKEFEDGGKGEWYPNAKAAAVRTDELKKLNISFTRKSAKNHNGIWVYTTK